MSYTYKTKGDTELVIVGHGVTVDGIIKSETPIENPNLELVEEEKQPSYQADNHVQAVVPQNVQPTSQPEQSQPNNYPTEGAVN